MAIKINNEVVIDNNKNITAGIGSFTQIFVPPYPVSFQPSNAATDVSTVTNITLSYSEPIQKGTGNITIRSGSATGTILETINVTSNNVTITDQTVVINPTNNFPSGSNIYVVVPVGVFIGSGQMNSRVIDTYNFFTAVSSISPSNQSTNQSLSTNITFTFDSTPVRGTGTITLRSGSASGTIVESYDAASSNRISISGNNWILDPTSNLSQNTSIFVFHILQIFKRAIN